MAPSFVVCLSHKESSTSPEEVYVVYQPDFASDDIESRMSTLHTLMHTVILFISARPRVLPLPPGRLEKTTLGKLLRPKIQNAPWQKENTRTGKYLTIGY